jgi:5-methylcytosine-specific restriction endonuclease McrA
MTNPHYADAAWRAVRQRILRRDGYVCQIKGDKCRGRATHVDHVVNVLDGGARLDPANLRAACASCNIGKRNSEVAARARRQRAGDDGEPSSGWVTPSPSVIPSWPTDREPTPEERYLMTGYRW